MKTVLTIAAATLLSAAALSASAGTQGYDQYRRAVLGDTTIAAPAVASHTVLVPGSYAQYLINNGATKSSALATAAAVGEQPRYDSVAIQAPAEKLSPIQAYAKSIGGDVVASRAITTVTNAE